MPNELPTLQDLQGTYGAWNPDAYTQAKSNQDLAGMYQQQALLQHGIKTQQDLESLNQSYQMNPELVNQIRLGNTGKQQANESGAMDLERKYAIQGQVLQQDQVDAITKLKESDFKVMEQHGRELLQDPATRAQGEQILNGTKEMWMLNQEHARKMELERLKGSYDLQGRSISAAGSGSKGGATKPSFANILAKRGYKDRAGLVAGVLQSGVNPDTNQPLSEIEQSYFNELLTRDQEQINADLRTRGGQGLVMSTTPEGKIVPTNKAPAQVGRSSPTEGQTKSGIKFKVLPQ